MLSLDKVYQAAYALKDAVWKTGLIKALRIPCSCELYLKTENLQVTGSFKVRGAYYKMSCLSPEERQSGVIACSAGNHAQGVALAAQKNGVSASIYIPATAPLSKVEATKAYGAEVVLVDGVYDDAYQAARKAQQEEGKTFIHPFDDEDVITGQGTIALEILEQLPEAEAVVVPIGGGGLIGGIAFTIKKLHPQVKVYGVQAAGASSMKEALEKGSIAALKEVRTFADGIAVKTPGTLTYELCKNYVDAVVQVSEDEIAAAVLALMEQQKLVAEGAGAAALAAVMFGKLPLEGKKTVCLVSGGNIDVNILSRVIHRGLLKSGRIFEITIELIDRPGQLTDISRIIADLGANVIKVNHNYGARETDINGCFLQISMETRNTAHSESIRSAIIAAGYKITK